MFVLAGESGREQDELQAWKVRLAGAARSRESLFALLPGAVEHFVQAESGFWFRSSVCLALTTVSMAG